MNIFTSLQIMWYSLLWEWRDGKWNENQTALATYFQFYEASWAIDNKLHIQKEFSFYRALLFSLFSSSFLISPILVYVMFSFFPFSYIKNKHIEACVGFFIWGKEKIYEIFFLHFQFPLIFRSYLSINIFLASWMPQSFYYSEWCRWWWWFFMFSQRMS